MNTHEYQAKEVLKKYNIPVPPYYIISSMGELEALLKTHPLEEAVLKIQIHAGGRGKAGGVKIAHGRDEIRAVAQEMLGKKFFNNQTGIHGLVANTILISPLIHFTEEYYLGAIIDRQLGKGVIIASPSGGVDIEKIAQESPEKVLKIPIPDDGILKNYHYLNILNFMNWRNNVEEKAKSILQNLVSAFIDTDASLLEINPLVKTKAETLTALDAKWVIDDNALFRHPDFKDLFDSTQMLDHEAQAQKNDLAYVALDGDIGCMVNGAGLAMATMDIIQLHGGKPANFLDVGGGATKEKVAQGFKIILSDPQVKSLLVNIFGGIMNCETISLGIIAASQELNIHVPLIVRLEGTNVEKGKQLLQEARLNITIANSLSDAAEAAVLAVKNGVRR